MTETLTAEIAFARYERAFNDNALIQGAWHKEQDGRQLACGLGVLGEDVEGPADCPAAVMPRWLAQMVPWLFDSQAPEDAYRWGLGFYAELKRLDGQVPFTVIYDWHANVATVMGIEAAEKCGRDATPHKALQSLHLRALVGDRAPADEWRPVLKSAYAYANADAYAYANANAYANAYAHAYAYAYANAYAHAYAYAYAYANANAYAHAYAYKKAVARLAGGLVECLRRVPTLGIQAA